MSTRKGEKVMESKDAEKHGAVVRLYHEVIGFQRDGKRVSGVTVKDVRSNTYTTVYAPIVLNLAGAWIPKIAAMAGLDVKLRPGKGVHLVLDRKLSNKRIYPAVDLVASSTRRDDLLIEKEMLQKIWILRKHLADMNPLEAMEFLKDRLKNTQTNEEFIISMNG